MSNIDRAFVKAYAKGRVRGGALPPGRHEGGAPTAATDQAASASWSVDSASGQTLRFDPAERISPPHVNPSADVESPASAPPQGPAGPHSTVIPHGAHRAVPPAPRSAAAAPPEGTAPPVAGAPAASAPAGAPPRPAAAPARANPPRPLTGRVPPPMPPLPYPHAGTTAVSAPVSDYRRAVAATPAASPPELPYIGREFFDGARGHAPPTRSARTGPPETTVEQRLDERPTVCEAALAPGPLPETIFEGFNQPLDAFAPVLVDLDEFEMLARGAVPCELAPTRLACMPEAPSLDEPAPQGSATATDAGADTRAGAPAARVAPPSFEPTPSPEPQPAAPFHPVWEVDGFDYPRVVQGLIAADGPLPEAAAHLSAAAGEGLKILMVTSPYRGAGRTTLAIALSRLVAASGKRVLLVDGDLDHPQMAERLQLEIARGWADALQSGMSLEEVAVQSLEDGLTLLPLVRGAGSAGAGTASARPSEARVAEMLRAMEGAHDLVVIDAPHVNAVGAWLPGTGAQVCIDAALLVCDLRDQDPDSMTACVRRLRQLGIENIGIAENFNEG